MRRVRAKRRGWVFTPSDVADLGSRGAVDVALQRLVDAGQFGAFLAAFTIIRSGIAGLDIEPFGKRSCQGDPIARMA